MIMGGSMVKKWLVHFNDGKSGEHIEAAYGQVSEGGALVFFDGFPDAPELIKAFAPGAWKTCERVIG